MFLSSQPWNKKENARSKVSESGKRCTRTYTSHVASGVENGQVAPPLRSAEYCHTFTAVSQVAYVASWLAAFRAFRSHVLFSLLHCCELRTTCNSFAIVASAVPAGYNANAVRAPGRPAWRFGYENNTYAPLENKSI